jgi:hypothetical protein
MSDKHETLAAALAALAQFDTPAERSAAGKTIHTRLEVILATAPPLLIAFREGRNPTRRELADKSGYRGDYAGGYDKIVGDSLGFADGGAKLHRTVFLGEPAYVRCPENVRAILEAIPEELHEGVAVAAGFSDLLEMATWAVSLPSVKKG